jgi:acyl-CoA dehydrogenase
VHKITLARQVLRDYQAGHELWPSEHLPTRREAAVAKLAEFLELEVAEQ